MKKNTTRHLDRYFGPVEISEGCPIPVVYQSTDKDIEDSILDAFGARYSADGTRLIGFEQRLPHHYTVKPGCHIICCNNDNDFILSAADCFDDLEELILPEGLEVVADHAFRGLKRVKHLIIPASVRFIGLGAFEVDADFEKTASSQLEKLEILSPDIFIYNFAFYGHTSLTSLNFSDPNTDTDEVRIGPSAFGECTSLRSLSLPGGTTLCGNPFTGCHLDGILTAPYSGYHFSNGFLTNDEDENCNVLVGYYGSDNEVVLPADINAIGSQAFFHNVTFQQAILPLNLVYIGPSAFEECTSLTSVVVPAHVGTIANFAFARCTALKTVTIAGPVETLTDGLFLGCIALEELTLPASIKSVQSDVFRQCKSLKTLSLPPYLEHIADNPIVGSAIATVVSQSPNFKVENDMLIDCCTDTLLAYFGNADVLTVPEAILQIGENAFEENTTLRHITLPASLCRVCNRAFFGCTRLEEVSIPSGVSSIGVSAFCGCASMTQVELHEGLKHIGRYAFYECCSLKGIVIPQSVVTLDPVVFFQGLEVTFAGIPQSIGLMPLTAIRVPKGTAEQFRQILPEGNVSDIIEY